MMNYYIYLLSITNNTILFNYIIISKTLIQDIT